MRTASKSTGGKAPRTKLTARKSTGGKAPRTKLTARKQGATTAARRSATSIQTTIRKTRWSPTSAPRKQLATQAARRSAPTSVAPPPANFQPCTWDDLQPARCYAENAVPGPSLCDSNGEARRAIVETLLLAGNLPGGWKIARSSATTDGAIWNETNTLLLQCEAVDGNGQASFKWNAAEIKAALPDAVTAEHTRANVGLARCDAGHPAFTHDGRSYLAYAKQDVSVGRVLGQYTGQVEVGGGDAGGGDRCVDLVQGLVYCNAERICNELSFINDFRTDVQSFDDPSKQIGPGPNCEFVGCWVYGEPFPKVLVIATQNIASGTELTLDYGESYWFEMLRRKAAQADARTRLANAVGRLALSPLPRYSIYSQACTVALSKEDHTYKLLRQQVMQTVVRHKKKASGEIKPAPRLQIDHIQYIQTPRLQEKYIAEVQDIIGMCDKGKVVDALEDVDALRVQSFTGKNVNEFLLFHGAPSSLIERLSLQGFDTRYAGDHKGKMFGHGVYFASNSSKSDIYTKADIPGCPGLRCLLVTRVCLGEPYRAASHNSKMRKPPDRPDGKGPLSSVVGLRQDEGGELAHREYIVYKEAQSLPQYAVWYKHEDGCQCTHCE